MNPPTPARRQPTRVNQPPRRHQQPTLQRSSSPATSNTWARSELPDESGGSSWDYSGRGFTYYPDGDPVGGEDGFPGSLFGVGHDLQEYVSEISIPVPVLSKNLEDLNTAGDAAAFC